MAFQLDDLVIAGAIYNTHPFSVHGQLLLRGQEFPFAVDLTGRLGEELRGRHFEFEFPANDHLPSEEDRRLVTSLRGHQIGAVGKVAISFVQDPAESAQENPTEVQPPHGSTSEGQCQCLYLEWFSQNGQIILELWYPQFRFVEIDPPRKRKKYTEPKAEDADGNVIPEEEREPFSDEPELPDPFPITEVDAPLDEEDGFGLVPKELDQALELSAHRLDHEIAAGSEEGSDDIRELELIDEIMESDDGVPIAVFLQKLSLPALNPELTEPQAEQALKAALTELAPLGVAFHVCEHCTAIDAYRILMEHVGVIGKVHPKMPGTDWVQNYMTHDSCKQCEAEFE